MLDLEGHAPQDPAPLPSGDMEAMFFAPAPARTITPRRPLRLSPAREDASSDLRQNLAALNIFADVFDAEPAPATDANLDPRVAASRNRIRARIDRHGNALAPEEANFWHSSVSETAPDLPVFAPPAPLPANDLPDLPLALHEHLARVREALYAQTPDGDAQILDLPSVQIRLASHAMTATLVVVAFPVGAALTTYSLFRGANIRLSAQAMALVASVFAFWQTGLSHLL